jgi:nicotinate-nucleotide adenylyltransferase
MAASYGAMAWYLPAQEDRGPAALSEKRDLWVPAVLFLAGVGLLAWHTLGAKGSVPVGIAALVLAIVGALVCLPLRIRHGQGRVMAFGAGIALVLAALRPGQDASLTALLPWIIAALAFLAPIRAAPVRTRGVLLVLAGVFAVLAALSAIGMLPREATWLFAAGALFLAAQVWSSRPRPEKAPPPGARVCVFGGTFDPFHKGHRALAEAALRVNDRLLVVVAGAAPHKFLDEDGAQGDQTPFHHRVAMTRLGVEGLPRTEVLEMEGRRRGPSYTVDTLHVLVSSHPPGTRFRVLLGADMFRDFTTWKDWQRIAQRATLLVAKRPGSELEPPPELAGEDAPVLGLEAPRVDASGTAIRAAYAAGHDPGPVVSPAIKAYIRDHGLYAPEGPEEP